MAGRLFVVLLLVISFLMSNFSYAGDEYYIKKYYNKLVRELKKEGIYLLSFPYNLPDGWILTDIHLDDEGLYTRIFKFNDITNDERYAVMDNDCYRAWCIDQNMLGDADHSYMVRLFNLGQKLPDYGKLQTPKGEVDVDEFFKNDYNGEPIPYQKVLYIINHRDGYSKAEVQEAIWYFTMGPGHFEPETTRYMELVNDAEEYGEEYVPSCGEKFIIFAMTRAAEETPRLEPMELGQPFIIELPIPEWLCKNRKLLDEYLHDYD